VGGAPTTAEPRIGWEPDVATVAVG